MSDPRELEDQIRTAGEAEMILSHPMVQGALDALRADAYSKIEMTKPSQKEEREFLYHRLQAINGFEQQFQFHIENGRMAVSLLDQYRAKKATQGRRR